ncbi:UvrD-helicase domain-containing protein [Chloroflexota bacterium]
MKTTKDKSDWLKALNPQQREAVTYGDGSLLVVAGAGSGKTRTLAYRVAYLISQGISPGRILLLTFTRRASEEMLKRAASAVQNGATAMSQVWGGTFHAFANCILRIYSQAADLPSDASSSKEESQRSWNKSASRTNGCAEPGV